MGDISPPQSLDTTEHTALLYMEDRVRGNIHYYERCWDLAGLIGLRSTFGGNQSTAPVVFKGFRLCLFLAMSKPHANVASPGLRRSHSQPRRSCAFSELVPGGWWGEEKTPFSVFEKLKMRFLPAPHSGGFRCLDYLPGIIIGDIPPPHPSDMMDLCAVLCPECRMGEISRSQPHQSTCKPGQASWNGILVFKKASPALFYLSSVMFGDSIIWLALSHSWCDPW